MVLMVLEVILVVLGVVLVVLGVVLRQCSEQMFGTDSFRNSVPSQHRVALLAFDVENYQTPRTTQVFVLAQRRPPTMSFLLSSLLLVVDNTRTTSRTTRTTPRTTRITSRTIRTIHIRSPPRGGLLIGVVPMVLEVILEGGGGELMIPSVASRVPTHLRKKVT